MKTKLLIAAVMFLALSVAAFAQATFTVSSIPVTTVASCGATELTGNVILTTVTNSLNVQTGTITINYGVPITSPLASISLIGTTAGLNASIVSTTTNLSAGLLVISLAPGGGSLVPPATIQISGVRVNVSGSPTLTNLTASVSATGNAIVAGQQAVVVISSIATSLVNFGTSVSTASAVAAATAGAVTPTTQNVGVLLRNNFIGAFAQGQLIQLNFTSTIPGAQINALPATVNSNTGQVFNLIGAPAAGGVFGAVPTAPISLSTTAVSIYYQATTPTAGGLTGLDFLPIGGTFAAGPPATFTANGTLTIGFAATTPKPLASGTVTVSAQLAPPSSLEAIFGSNTFSYIPVYGATQCATNTATILTVTAPQTVLLMPYVANQLGFDTGISIANTTMDPGIAAGFVPATTAQSGTITFYFYPQAGTAPAPYTTSATSPGSGLTAGVLNAGGSYTVLASQLLGAAGFTGNFQGYVFAICNFTNAHGLSTVTDFTHVSQGALMLVVPEAARPNTGGVPENLNN